MTQRRKFAAGNWKMHGLTDDLAQAERIAQAARDLPGIVTVLCLPATLLARAQMAGLALGGQDCHAAPQGAHTGDISARMLSDAGAGYVIVGHSERRSDHGETDADINAKTRAAWDAGLTAVLCIGETRAQYEAGQTLDVLRSQIGGSLPDGATADNTVVAYEPVWAIGTGLTPTIAEIGNVHAAVRTMLADAVPTGAQMSVLYGGSVKPANAAEIFALPDVDGGLVGGASLKAADFVPIMQALAQD
jgi:triosephosphate isomerase